MTDSQALMDMPLVTVTPDVAAVPNVHSQRVPFSLEKSDTSVSNDFEEQALCSLSPCPARSVGDDHCNVWHRLCTSSRRVGLFQALSLATFQYFRCVTFQHIYVRP
jgi:hypothetical protein